MVDNVYTFTVDTSLVSDVRMYHLRNRCEIPESDPLYAGFSDFYINITDYCSTALIHPDPDILSYRVYVI
jgi:hypothetical protein